MIEDEMVLPPPSPSLQLLLSGDCEQAADILFFSFSSFAIVPLLVVRRSGD